MKIKKMYSGATKHSKKDPAMQHSPVILLLSNRAQERDAVDKWLAESRYTSCDAVDVFQALEHVSDFTTSERPDVILLHVDSVAADIELMRTVVATSPGDPDVPIIDLSSEIHFKRSDENFEDALGKLVCKLDQFIPHHDAPTI